MNLRPTSGMSARVMKLQRRCLRVRGVGNRPGMTIQQGENPSGPVAVVSTGAPQADGADVEYLRRIYAAAREWYTVAETKAQLLLVVNGTFITIMSGAVLGKADDVRAQAAFLAPVSWALLGLAAVCVVSAVSCAALSMWSLHGAKSLRGLRTLGVDVKDPDTYRAEALWYFGQMARLEPSAAIAGLRRVNRQSEIDSLSYHVVELSGRVLRKHKFVNAGWMLTAASLIALCATAVTAVAGA